MVSFTLSAILTVIAGLLVLVSPKMLRWVVGLYLLVWGIVQIF